MTSNGLKPNRKLHQDNSKLSKSLYGMWLVVAQVVHLRIATKVRLPLHYISAKELRTKKGLTQPNNVITIFLKFNTLMLKSGQVF